ncbi:transcriptional regulator NrdR [Oscillospiraceae bacterium LCP25S3_E10]|nr:transcriptional regulator NrdR [Ruminococcus sp.]MDD6447782.1 transcriptional regulator NrdR [Ruminococcus sp.]MDY2855547.1 transcriptional regulator NrdR [Oscillospiraceae bacterium]
MKCPYCSCEESKVIDSRSADDGERIRRRRECLNCGKRFTTHEVIETVPIMVVKRDRTRELFSREKLSQGLMRACEKRPVSVETIEGIINKIEMRLQNSLEREVTSQTIGEYAMEYLKEVDEVAYVRFASVYRQFKDINTFREELNKLLQSK